MATITSAVSILLDKIQSGSLTVEDETRIAVAVNQLTSVGGLEQALVAIAELNIGEVVTLAEGNISTAITALEAASTSTQANLDNLNLIPSLVPKLDEVVSSLTTIGDFRALHINDVDGLAIRGSETWLRTGVIENDITLYPDAKVTTIPSSGSFTSFVISQDSNPHGVIRIDDHIWVLGYSSSSMYKYTLSGTYTNTSFSLSGQTSQFRGVTWDGGFFWAVSNVTDTVYKYTASGTYTGISFSVSSQVTSPTGLTWDGTHFWVIGASNDYAVQYTPEGVFTERSIQVGTQENNPQGITWDGTHFYIVGTQNNTVFKYNAEGEYTGENFTVGLSSTCDIFAYGNDLYFVDTSQDAVTLRTHIEETYYVGTPNRSIDISTGSPIYLRIK